jgi:cytochrome c oxidase cbb3-type subunit 3
MATDKSDVDAFTGTATTGHEWDGIRELNTPLPRWWLWLFYLTIIWAVGYWIVYPSWPLVSSFTTGVFGWHSRAAIVDDLAALKALRGPMTEKLAATALADIKADQALADFTYAQGRSSFRENCGPCHGAGGGGAKGYPNLNDNEWLWGGTLGEIQQTIEFGIRSGHAKAHESQMPAFGKDGMLKRDEIVAVANQVRALANLPTRPGVDLAAGKKIYADNCAVCHGPDGKGNRELGAPNLTDGIWLFGSDEATIVEVIANSRGGVMPAWAGRLDPMTIKALTFYVHSLGGGER